MRAYQTRASERRLTLLGLPSVNVALVTALSGPCTSIPLRLGASRARAVVGLLSVGGRRAVGLCSGGGRRRRQAARVGTRRS